ncbi:MAG: histidine ammonia-lyase [Chloroflexia bacterium]
MHYNYLSDGTNLTPQDVALIARSHNPGNGKPFSSVSMSPDAQGRVNRSRVVVDRIVSQGEVVYGITTGFGAFKDRVIPHEDLAQLQVNLILSQCVGVGPPFPAEVVRAMMLCRAHTLSLGYSGIRLETLQLLYDMLNAGIHPLIPEQGSVGASGDLAPLSHMALSMLGLGQSEYQGNFISSADALHNAGLEPCVLGPKEGLALSNGTSLMSALLSLALVDAAMLCDTADVVGAMTLEALQGVPAAFDPRIHAARGQQGQIASAALIRALTEGSNLLDWGSDPDNNSGPNPKSTKVQDAYSLRCMPQVHGPARDTVAYVNNILTIEINGANDNPLVFPDDDDLPDIMVTSNDQSKILSGGNFHGAPVSIASDFLGIAVTQLANISERRQARLVDTAAHGGLLPAFLIEHGGLNSGFMMVQYTSAALASENKSLAHPASVDTIPTSANIEDHVSMGPIAGRHARAIIANTTRILALEAMMAAQALDFRMRAQPVLGHSPIQARMGNGTRAAYHLIRQHVPFLEKDVNFQPHIAAMESLVLNGALANIAKPLANTHPLPV